MLFWQPVDPDHLEDPRTGSPGSLRATSTRTSSQWARDAKAWGGPILAKFAQEMNGTWFPWSVGHFTNTRANFVQAWRHIVNVVRHAGATNVRFVWAPILPCTKCTPVADLYPGDRYVDYAGFSSFDWRDDRSLATLVRHALREIAPLTALPVIVTELGTPAGHDKIAWIRDGYRAVHDKFPQVFAIVYFDVRVAGQPDWRLDQPTGALHAYRALFADPRFTDRMYDTQAPTDGQVTILGGRAYTNTRAVSLTLGASDDVGVTAMQVSEDPHFRGAAWRPYATGASFELSTGDGTKTVYARYRDFTRNVSHRVSDTIVLDRAPPRVSAVPARWWCTGRDRTDGDGAPGGDRCGFRALRLSAVNESGAWSAWFPWPRGESSVDVTWKLSSGDGHKTVHVQLRDRARGTSATAAATIALDTSATTAGGQR